MPEKKPTKKKTAAQKAADALAKSRAKNVKKANKYVTKGKKIGAKAAGKEYSSKRKTQVKGMAQTQTADKFIKAGKKVIKAGGQGSLPKRKALRTTPRSIQRDAEDKDRFLKPQKKGAGKATTRRPKKK